MRKKRSVALGTAGAMLCVAFSTFAHAQLIRLPYTDPISRGCGPGTHMVAGQGCISDQTQPISTPTPITTLPPVPLTVADCHPGDHWGPSPSHGGLLRCLPDNPPPAPKCLAGYTQTAAPVWDGEAWSAPRCTLNLQPLPSNPPLTGHVLIATTDGEAICQTPGTVNAYADGTYEVTNDNLGFATGTGSNTATGTWNQMISQAPSHRNKGLPIAEPADPNYAVSWLGQYYSFNNPWDCGGGVG